MEGHEPLNLKLYAKNHKLELKSTGQNVFVETRYPLPPGLDMRTSVIAHPTTSIV